MSDLSSAPPPDPVAGEPGVFDYIDWLKTSILELDAAKARALDVLAKAGGTMTGDLTIGTPGDSVPKGIYLRSGGTDPTNGVRLVPYKSAGGEGLVVQTLDSNGDAVASANVIIADPVTPAGAATKNYVDAHVSGTFALDAAWTAYGGTYSQIRLRKSADKMVTLEGLIKRKTPGAVTETQAIQVGTLPAGFAPATQTLFPVLMQDSTSSVSLATRMQLGTDGTMIFNVPRSAAYIVWVSITCSWRAA